MSAETFNLADEPNPEYRQQEIKLQRDALVEYAENNTELSPKDRDQFIQAVLSDASFFKQACVVLQKTAGILWEAALLEEVEEVNGQIISPFSVRAAEFLEESKTDRFELALMRKFYLTHWEQAFTREQQDEQGLTKTSETGDVLYEVALEPNQYDLCESRILELQSQLA